MSTLCLADAPAVCSSTPQLNAHVVLMANFIPPHRLPLYLEFERRVRRLTIVLSTPMEANRAWPAEYGDLDVRVQNTTTFKRPRKHTLGFKDHTYVHIPWDTGKQLKLLKPDLILSWELGFRSLFGSLYKNRVKRVPLMYWCGLSEHTERGKGWHRHLLRKYLIRQADGVVVNGDSGARYLKRLGLAADRLFRIPYTADPQFYQHGSAERPAAVVKRLLFVGRQIEVKGLIPFLESLRRWGDRNPRQRVELHLAGSGPLKSAILAFQLPPNVRIELLGESQPARLMQIYANSGIFAFPSLADDWGISVNEALASGLPVLGSIYSQGVQELCVEGETGWRFRTDQADEMDAAMTRALSTPPEQLARMRQRAREKVSSLTPQFAANCLVGAVETVLNRFREQA